MRYKSPAPISNIEFRRRVFNSALCECFAEIHARALDLTDRTIFGSYPDANQRAITEMANNMAKSFFRAEMDLDKATIAQTKKNLSEASTFIKDCVALCEGIADEKAAAAKENEVVATDDMKEPELNAEERDLIKNLFDRKDPEVEADAVRDATVKALLAEREKANKIKEATSIAQQASEQNGDKSKLEETVTRLGSRGPTSLMHAITNMISEAAVQDVLSQNPKAKIGEILKENADEITTRSAMMYALYECENAFSIKKYSRRDIEKLAKEIYDGQ